MDSDICSIPLHFQILKESAVPNPGIKLKTLEGGLINATFLVTVTTTPSNHDSSHQKEERYILQRINSDVFKNIDGLMRNMEKVSLHLQSKGRSEKKAEVSASNCLVIIPTTDNKSFWKSDKEDCSQGFWRMLHYIPNSITYPVAPSDMHLYEAGCAFGKFQRNLSDFTSLNQLIETIPDFHDTPKRLDNLLKAVKDDVCNRVQNACSEIRYIESQSDIVNLIVEMLNDGRLPKRVTHNDTKLENVLFDSVSQRALCVIDYDTIMPNGSMLYDFGDSIRSMSNTSSENEINLAKVDFNLKSYEEFTKGFLSQVGGIITDEEKELLPKAAMIITLEQSIRFLTDYLMGDVYFKITSCDQNLFRTRNQLTLFKKMLLKEVQMKEITMQIESDHTKIAANDEMLT